MKHLDLKTRWDWPRTRTIDLRDSNVRFWWDSKDDSIDILNKLKELKFIEETTVEVDGESINLYKTRQFPKIVGLFAYLDLVSKANKKLLFLFW